MYASGWEAKASRYEYKNSENVRERFCQNLVTNLLWLKVMQELRMRLGALAPTGPGVRMQTSQQNADSAESHPTAAYKPWLADATLACLLPAGFDGGQLLASIQQAPTHKVTLDYNNQAGAAHAARQSVCTGLHARTPTSSPQQQQQKTRRPVCVCVCVWVCVRVGGWGI